MNAECTGNKWLSNVIHKKCKNKRASCNRWKSILECYSDCWDVRSAIAYAYPVHQSTSLKLLKKAKSRKIRRELKKYAYDVDISTINDYYDIDRADDDNYYVFQNKLDSMMLDAYIFDMKRNESNCSNNKYNIDHQCKSSKYFYNKTKNKNKYSFESYWKEMKDIKIYYNTDHDDEEILIENDNNYNNNNNNAEIMVDKVMRNKYDEIKNLIPSIEEIECRLKLSYDYRLNKLNIKCILEKYLLDSFYQYALNKRYNNIVLVYTLSWYIRTNKQINNNMHINTKKKYALTLSGQQLLIHGYIRQQIEIIFYNNNIPLDIIFLCCSFYAIENSLESWRFNGHNASKYIKFYENAYVFNSRCNNGKHEIFVCLLNKTDAFQPFVARMSSILPIYKVTWNDNSAFSPWMRARNWSRNDVRSYERNVAKKKSQRVIQRKWSAYHKLNKFYK